MMKRHRSCVELLPHDVVELILERLNSSRVELLPHDVIERILERLPVESLLRFKRVSKKWRSTIESQRFQERQFMHRRQSGDTDELFVLAEKKDDGFKGRRIVFKSSILTILKLPFNDTIVGYSCDGLLCLYSIFTPNVVVNPATSWHQSFPFSDLQHRLIDKYNKGLCGPASVFDLGLGKDKFRGTYKPVCLYNSSEHGLDNATTCEVFDFSTNAWRFVHPASPCRILASQKPVYFDGSLYWLTECEETKLLSFDLHTETFQVICKPPFVGVSDPRFDLVICILDNRLCVSERNWPKQVIWSLDSSSASNKTWTKLCSIDLTKILSLFNHASALVPVAILEKHKLLLHGRRYFDPLVIHDLHTKTFHRVFKPTSFGYAMPYLESLMSV